MMGHDPDPDGHGAEGTDGTHTSYRSYSSYWSYGPPADDFDQATAIGAPRAEFHNNDHRQSDPSHPAV